jgi:hypothetical protein
MDQVIDAGSNAQRLSRGRENCLASWARTNDDIAVGSAMPPDGNQEAFGIVDGSAGRGENVDQAIDLEKPEDAPLALLRPVIGQPYGELRKRRLTTGQM